MSTSRPDSYLDWTDGSVQKVVTPPSSLKLEGWDAGQAPPNRYMNWLFYKTDQWIKYFDILTNTGVPEQAIRMINGGFYSFSSVLNKFSWNAPINIAIPGSLDSANAIASGNVTLLDGYLAYTSLSLPVITTGNLANGSNIVSSMNFTGNLTPGMSVLGQGIASNTTVLSVSATSVVLSNPATTDLNNATLLFSIVNALTMQIADSKTFIPDLSHLVLARRVGGRVFVGINSGQMVLQNGESKKLLETGYTQTYDDVLAGEALTAGQAVYISQGGSGDGFRTVGSAYMLDCSPGNPQRSFFAGFAVEDAASGTSVKLVFDGFIQMGSLTPGAIYYGSDSILGGVSTPKPSNAGSSIMPVGMAVSSSKLLLTTSEGLVGPQNQSIFQDEQIGIGNDTKTIFPISQAPLDQNSTFIFKNGLLVSKTDWSLVGLTIVFLTAPTAGSLIEAQYIQSNQLNISAKQESPTQINPTTFQLAGLPLNQSSLMVYVDGMKIKPDEYNLLLMSNGAQIILNDPAEPGQSVDAIYFQNIAGSGGYGVVTAGSNEGSGQPLFHQIVAGVMKFFSLMAGPNISLSNDGLGNLVISSTAGSGSSRQVFGTPAAPATFDSAFAGLAPGAQMDQTWIIKPSIGIVPVTSSTQIQNGIIIGQRITLRGTSTTDYYQFSNLRNLSLSLLCNITDNQSLTVEWDGVVWFEICRRS